MKKMNLTLIAAIVMIASAVGVQASSNSAAKNAHETGSMVTDAKTDLAGDTVIVEKQVGSIEDLVVLSGPSDGMNITTYLKNNIRYPKKAIDEGIEGYVKVFVTVEKNGTLSNVLPLEGNNELLTSEVLKTLRKATVQPIVQNGQPARYSLIVPVYFRFDK